MAYIVLCLLLCPLWAGCGVKRIQTAVHPDAGGADDAATGGDGDGEALDSAIEPDSPPPMKRDAGPPAIDVRVLFDESDFDESFIYGETTSDRFEPTDTAFTRAWRTKMNVPPAVPWDAQLVIPLLMPVVEGELLEASFWVRCAQPPGDGMGGVGGPCLTEFAFELSQEPWTRSVETAIDVTDSWVLHTVPFRTVAAYAPGEAGGLFRVGYPDQVLEIGGIVLRSLGVQ